MSGRSRYTIGVFVGDERTGSESVSRVEVLRLLRGDDTWPELAIVPRDGDFPLMNVSFHDGRGYVLQCYKYEASRSDFLVTGRELSEPSIEIDHGGQARERWPAELFVPEQLGARAVEHLLARGDA